MNTLPSIPELASLVVAWLVTYLLHSTLLLGAAWGATRQLAGRAPAVADVIWKTALVGGLVTASLQVGWGALAPRPTPFSTPGPALGATWLEPVDLAAQAQLAPPVAEPHPVLGTLSAQLAGWQRLLLTTWGTGALVGAIALLVAWRRLQRHLANRRLVTEGPARQCLDELAATLGEPGSLARRVRLTGSAELPVPVALGVLQPEICLPERALAELPEAERRGLLAHELGHVVRRDPLWLLFAHALERLFFLQPLHRLARRKLQETSELLADAWALRATGDRHGLARCLVEVASWLRSPQVGLPAPGMAGPSGAHLQSRVARILAAAGDGAPRWRAVTVAVAVAALVGVVVFGPGLAPLPLGASPAPEATGERAAEPAGSAVSARGAATGSAQAGTAARADRLADEAKEAEEAELAEVERALGATASERRASVDRAVRVESERIAELARALAERALAEDGNGAAVAALAAARRELQRALELHHEAYAEATAEAREALRAELEAAAMAHRDQYQQQYNEMRGHLEAELRRARGAVEEEMSEALREAREGQRDALEVERKALRDALHSLHSLHQGREGASATERLETERELEALLRRLSELDRAALRGRVGIAHDPASAHAGEPSCADCPPADEEEGDPPV